MLIPSRTTWASILRAPTSTNTVSWLERKALLAAIDGSAPDAAEEKSEISPKAPKPAPKMLLMRSS